METTWNTLVTLMHFTKNILISIQRSVSSFFCLGGFYEKDKNRLANIMAYGEDIPPPDWRKAIKRMNLDEDDRKEVDRFDERKYL